MPQKKGAAIGSDSSKLVTACESILIDRPFRLQRLRQVRENFSMYYTERDSKFDREADSKRPESTIETRSVYLLVNFGGPRSAEEIEPFLKELLRDRDVIRTKFPTWLHNWLFGRIARKRALKIRLDYERIGFSPIYGDTEAIKRILETMLGSTVLTFHRYLPATHRDSLLNLEKCKNPIRVVPLFPQFCYGTTGSIARFFSNHLSKAAQSRLQWIKSYGDHPEFISAWQKKIARFLEENTLEAKETILLFSAHGVPRSFIEEGDPYEEECQRSFSAILKGFPDTLGRLSYQSKFGRGEWLRPYTDEACQEILSWHEGRKAVVFVPLTFTSDHIETLFEIEELYLPIIRSRELKAYRCPALNFEPEWIFALETIAKRSTLHPNQALIR